MIHLWSVAIPYTVEERIKLDVLVYPSFFWKCVKFFDTMKAWSSFKKVKGIVSCIKSCEGYRQSCYKGCPKPTWSIHISIHAFKHLIVGSNNRVITLRRIWESIHAKTSAKHQQGSKEILSKLKKKSVQYINPQESSDFCQNLFGESKWILILTFGHKFLLLNHCGCCIATYYLTSSSTPFTL